jgi:hypothetical protein
MIHGRFSPFNAVGAIGKHPFQRRLKPLEHLAECALDSRFLSRRQPG